MYKLPVFSTIGETYRFIGNQFSPLVNYAMIPVLLNSLLATLVTFSSISLAGGYGGLPNISPEQAAEIPRIFDALSVQGIFILSLALTIVFCITYILFAVGWHRRYLLGPDATSPLEIFVWRRRHWRFLWKAVLLVIFGVIISLIFSAVLILPVSALAGWASGLGTTGSEIALTAVNWIISIPILLLYCSVLLAFPAAAVDDLQTGIFRSMTLTRGNLWRMAIVFFIGIYWPFYAASATVSWLINTPTIFSFWSGSIGLGFVAMLIAQSVNFAGLAIGVSALSIMYEKFTDNVSVQTAPEGPATS